jgi:tyrosyl-tRNA synthetase
VPLLTTAAGAKFGKSAGNAVWLDPIKTSAFHFYQYLLNTRDDDLDKLFKLLTFLPLEEV